MRPPERVTVVEVGPRDGLQNQPTHLSAEDKIQFIEMLAESGLPVVEVSSFVSPKWVPQLGDAAEVFAGLERREGVRYPALIPNEKGLERAMEAGVTEFAFFTAASDSFNQRNLNMTVAQSLSAIRQMKGMAGAFWTRAYVSTAFYCPYEGRIASARAVPLVEELLAIGINEVSVGDTVGWATPLEVEELSLALGAPDRLAFHFHDTRGIALANVLAALQCGFTVFDSSAGGLGGCPFAPGAAGNLATEDLVYMLAGMGIETGVDLAKVVAASRFAASKLGRSLPGKYLQSQGG